MPTDPVYNPHLPSASMSSSRSSNMSSRSSWSSDASASQSCTSWSALSCGLVTGAIAGAALALAYAPMRGSQMRSSIRRYASDGSERLARMVESGRSAAEDAIHRAASLIEEGRSAFRTGSSPSSISSATSHSSSQPLTASVAEISGVDRRFEEPLGG
jgi:gas vesicle protein